MSKKTYKRLTDLNWPAIQAYYDDNHSLDETVGKFHTSHPILLNAKKKGLFVPRSIKSSISLRRAKGKSKPTQQLN